MNDKTSERVKSFTALKVALRNLMEGNGRNRRWANRAIALTVACALFFGSAFFLGCSSEQSADAEQDQAKGVLSFQVVVDEQDSLIKPLTVIVSGTTDDGEEIEEKYKAVPGEKYDLEYGGGEYVFVLDSDAEYNGEIICLAATETCSFDGEKDNTVVLHTAKDVEATDAAEKAIEEKKAADEKAAAEEQAQKEAEEAERQRVEQEEAAAAAAAAAAEQQRVEEEAAAAAAQSEPVGTTVYVAASGNGKKYHSNPSCSNMSGTRELSQSSAEAEGYTPCKKCW